MSLNAYPLEKEISTLSPYSNPSLLNASMEIIRKIPVSSEQCRSGQSDSTAADSDPFTVVCGFAKHPARRVPIRTNTQSFLNSFIRSPFRSEAIRLKKHTISGCNTYSEIFTALALFVPKENGSIQVVSGFLTLKILSFPQRKSTGP